MILALLFSLGAHAKCVAKPSVKGPFKVVSVETAKVRCTHDLSVSQVDSAFSIITVRKGKKEFRIAEPTSGAANFRVGKTVKGSFTAPCCDHGTTLKCLADGKLHSSDETGDLESIACENKVDGVFDAP